MELGILGSLWANCALGATFLAVPTIPNLQNLSIPAIQTLPALAQTLAPQLIEGPVFQVQQVQQQLQQLQQVQQQIQQVEQIESLEQLEDFDETDDNSNAFTSNDQDTQPAESAVSESDGSESQDDGSDQEQDYDSDVSNNIAADISAELSATAAMNYLVMQKINILKTQNELNETECDEKTTQKQKKKKPYQRIRYGREEYRCDMCPYTCTTEKAFLKHLRGHSATDKDKEQESSDVPRLSCPVCGKDRSGEAALNKHMQRHRNDKNFCCDICSFKTVQLKKLIQHRRMHTGERPHLCPHCVYRAARRDNLRSHVRRVHKRDNLTCDTFSPRGMLIKPRTRANDSGEIDKNISREETM